MWCYMDQYNDGGIVSYVHFYPRDIRVAFSEEAIDDLHPQANLITLAREYIKAVEERMKKNFAPGSIIEWRRE